MRTTRTFAVVLLAIAWLAQPLAAANIWIEAESFQEKGGWLVEKNSSTELLTNSQTAGLISS